MKEKIERSIIPLAILFVIIPEITDAQIQTKSMLKEKTKEFFKLKIWNVYLLWHGDFVNREWATRHENTGLFNPSQLNFRAMDYRS